MKSRNFLVTLLSITAMLFLSLVTATSSAQAQTASSFSGRARGVVADAVIAGAVQANVTVSDTGQLPSTGGPITSTPVAANVNVASGAVTVVATAVNTQTSGGTAAGTPNSSQSQASVTNLNASVLGIPITATLVQSNSMCTCGVAPVCTGSTTLTNLVIGGVAINSSATATVNLTVTILGVQTVIGQVFINEQTVTTTGQNTAITVNALRISLNANAGILGLGTLAGTNIIIAQSQSDITCAAAPVAGADLAVNKTSTINGNMITNVITVTNIGTVAATDVVVTDVLPTNTTFVSATQTGAALTLTTPTAGTNGTITATGTLAAGASTTITIVSATNAAAGTSILNTATVASATTDVNVANNTAQATAIVPNAPAATADLAVTKTSTIDGNTITNVVTVRNNGPGTATNVVVTDVLPAETFFLSSSTTSGFTLSNPRFGTNGTVTGTLATLAAGTSASFTVVSEVFTGTTAGTVVTNTATATSSATDPFTANNTATTNVFVGFAPAPNNFAPAFSGRAIGAAADADVNIFGLVTDTARVGIADTGPLPSTGGRIVIGPITTAANVALGGGLTTVLAGSVFNSRTSGGIPGIPDGGNLSTSQSQATVTNLNILAGGIAIGATALTANTNCACGTICTGTSTIAGLTVGGTPINIVDIFGRATLTAPPNTTITLTVGGSTVTLILNEQIIGNGSITVNALRVVVTVGGVVTSNVVVAQAHSDIACFTGTPTAASVSIAGRVLSPSGRGISRARVLLTDSTGQTRSVMTNPFGYYSFSNVEAGSTYIFEVRDKRYTFTPQTISLTEGVTNFNFKAQQ